jgi:hypothetical protein
MNFQELLAKMQELDRPATEACGDSPMPPSMPMSMPSMPEKPDTPPPSMSLNLNAQGMDNIEELMKLMTKVNPDMINQPAPMSAISIEPMDKPMGGLPPLKMLPDMDSEPHAEPDADNMGGPSDMDADNMPPMAIQKAMGDQDGDGDHDMKDHDLEKKDDEEGEEEEGDDEEDKKEAWANEPDTDIKSVDYMNNQIAGGMNKPKGTHPKVAGGDNPMQRVKEGGDLRASIRAELQQRLAEARGAK